MPQQIDWLKLGLPEFILNTGGVGGTGNNAPAPTAPPAPPAASVSQQAPFLQRLLSDPIAQQLIARAFGTLGGGGYGGMAGAKSFQEGQQADRQRRQDEAERADKEFDMNYKRALIAMQNKALSQKSDPPDEFVRTEEGIINKRTGEFKERFDKKSDRKISKWNTKGTQAYDDQGNLLAYSPETGRMEAAGAINPEGFGADEKGTNYQKVTVSVGGKPKLALFDPANGKTLDMDTREEIKGAQPYYEPNVSVTVGGGGMTPAQVGASLKLSDDFEKSAKNFETVREFWDRIKLAATDPYGKGKGVDDLTIVFSFMKLQDPGSAVRSDERADAQNAAGVPDQIRNTWNRLLAGDRLPPSQRISFLKASQGIYQTEVAQQKRREKQFGDRAQRLGIDPSMVVRDMTSIDPDTTEPGLIIVPHKTRPGVFKHSTDGGKTWKPGKP